MKVTNSRIDIISCPHCGAQYTAGEIYVPEAFLGVPIDLERDAVTKKILFDFGKPMDTREKYTCDYCNTTFKISAYVKFNVEEEINDINKPYTTSLKKNSIFLKED